MMFCAAHESETRVRKNGVAVALRNHGRGGSVFRLYSGDLVECRAGGEAFIRTADYPYAESFQAGWDEKLAQAQEQAEYYFEIRAD